MISSYTLALSAAQEAAGAQHYPQAALYVVATPIGNLADISLRALHVLSIVDALACEDTRHTRALLHAYGLDKPLLAVHEHNEAQAAAEVVDRLRRGERIAYVSDAGTPGVSDPGGRLVATAREAGLRVMPVPGASSVVAALSVAGLAAEAGFRFAGFLPVKARERETALAALAADLGTVVLFEAPHRIDALARSLNALGGRALTVARELTKQHEEVATLTASDLSAWLAQSPHRTRGEFVLIVHPGVAAEHGVSDGRVLELLLAELPLKTAVSLASRITGEARNAVYDRALQMKKPG